MEYQIQAFLNQMYNTLNILGQKEYAFWCVFCLVIQTPACYHEYGWSCSLSLIYSPLKSGTRFQQVMAPCEVYWPSAISNVNIGIAPMITHKKYGMRKAPGGEKSECQWMIWSCFWYGEMGNDLTDYTGIKQPIKQPCMGKLRRGGVTMLSRLFGDLLWSGPIAIRISLERAELSHPW